MTMLSNILKLFGVVWFASLFPAAYLASRRGNLDAALVFDALGYSLIPFVVGLLTLLGFRKSDDGGWKAGLVAALVVLALALLGNLSAGP